jgi:hypothetical protein
MMQQLASMCADASQRNTKVAGQRNGSAFSNHGQRETGRYPPTPMLFNDLQEC